MLNFKQSIVHQLWDRLFKRKPQKVMMHKIGTLSHWALRKSTDNPMSVHALRKALQEHLAADNECASLTEIVIRRLQHLNLINDTRLAQTLALRYQNYGDRYIGSVKNQSQLIYHW